MMQPLKKNALLPEERVKQCPHEHVRWTGSIPCTGVRLCLMCGTEVFNQKQNDVQVQNEGLIFLFHLLTDTAEEWVDENVGESMRYGGALVVEHRYALDLAQGMLDDGLGVI